MKTKTELRQDLRARRKAVSSALRRRALRVQLALPHWHRWLKPGEKIGVYLPHGSEFPIQPLILFALRRGCRVYLPRVPEQGRVLSFHRLNQHTRWLAGAYGMDEPEHNEVISPMQLDLVLVPLLGFDQQLRRLGQGGGFYDSSFAASDGQARPRLIGCAYSSQFQPDLPLDAWDLRLDYLMSEQGMQARVWKKTDPTQRRWRQFGRTISTWGKT